MTSAHDGCSSPCNVCSPGPVSEVRAVESAGFSPAPSLPGERTQRGAGSSLPSSRGWGTGRDSRAGSNFRRWAEPRGKRRAAGTSRDAMPASNLGGERAPGGPRVAPCCQPGFAPWARAAGEAGGPGAVLLLIRVPSKPWQLRASVSLWRGGRRQEGWPGSGLLAWERQALLFPHDCLLLTPHKIRSSCSQ